MNLLLAILLGIVQGVTEWLPISSSGHLVIVQHMGGEEPPIFFDLMLHIGSMVVVLYLFRKEIWELLKALPKLLVLLPSTKKREEAFEKDPMVKLLFYLLLATIPIGVSGLLVKKFFEDEYKSLLTVGCGLIYTSAILFMIRDKDGTKQEKDMDGKNALIVGVFQSLAILPGVSRSGSTIAGGLLRDFDKEVAYRFSFLLFIPAMVGATAVELLDVYEEGYESSLILPTIVGTITAMITGYLTIMLLHKVVRERKLHLFAPYCFLLGLGLIGWYFFG